MNSQQCHRLLLVILAAFIIFMQAGCRTAESPETGTLKGTVYLVDSTGYRMPTFDNTTVSIVGTSLTTTTDSLGHWELQDVPEGAATIIFSKPGFGTVKAFGFDVPAPGITYVHNQSLAHICSVWRLSADSISTGYTDSIPTGYNGYVVVYGHPLNTSAIGRSAVLLISTDSNLSQSSPNTWVQVEWRSVTFEPQWAFETSVSSTDLHDLGFASGTKVFLSFSCMGDFDIATEADPSYYWDENLQHYVCTACTPHYNVLTAVVP